MTIRSTTEVASRTRPKGRLAGAAEPTPTPVGDVERTPACPKGLSVGSGT
jgi:hypothetical protein